MPAEDNSCLVARAVPVPAKKTIDVIDSEESLIENMSKMSVNPEKKLSASKRVNDLNPADFVQLQNLRSSALARKTNTTTKFSKDSDSLFDDLLLKDTTTLMSKISLKKVSAEKATGKENSDKKEKKDEKEEKVNEDKESKQDLLSRGPVRTSRPNLQFHPYGQVGFDQNSPGNFYPSEWQYREQLSNSSTPDTFNSDLGYSSSTSPSQGFQVPAEFGRNDLKGFLANAEDSELPDALSDFILKYSRRYTNIPQTHHNMAGTSASVSPVELSPKFGNRPGSVESNCDSPMSGVSASQSSPAAPHGGITGPSTPQSGYRMGCDMGGLRTQLPSTRFSTYVNKQGKTEPPHRPAKDVLRKFIQEVHSDSLDQAWAWTCKCQQYYPGALCYQDGDKDTLLHIVTQHMDIPKIYALVEQMLKMEYSSHDKPFDMPNKEGVTPLFLAVEKRNNIVVDYLLEVGASPNTQNGRYERDAPLHYAAARGMVDVVKTICSYSAANLNMTNGMGLTPLLCAIKNHGVFDEESKKIINNLDIIHVLLKYGADPMISDSTNGRTSIHYAVDRLSTDIIDVFKNNVEESVLTLLVNQTDNNCETPLESVQCLEAEETLKQKLGLSLIMCGANSELPSPDDYN
uniref:ANK_REP_REGION domain-containing protein n=1 Tax=Bursaphelenchus xylophilus TaxID=6326 RepID=A0A1I7ST59_BURXY